MKVSQWAEIRRLHEVEGLSQRQIAERLHCHRQTVEQALAMTQAPDEARRQPRTSLLDPYKPKIDRLVEQFPQLSAVRIAEEIRKDGYAGSVIILRRYLRTVRKVTGRVYQEVFYDPGEAMQVDWGHCGSLEIENTKRKLSVFVAVLCHSRMCYIEFTLSQRKSEFYRTIANSLEFFGGSPRKIIFDNLKAAVVNGSGKNACLHPEFLALCGHYYLEPIACERRDPESKGMVEAGVRYVKQNALAGRAEELTCFDDYRNLAITWRDEVANVRMHQAISARPVDRFEEERPRLRTLPTLRFDTDEITDAIVNTHARIRFDGNRYSVPPDYCCKPVVVRASVERVRILHEGREITVHVRSYARGKVLRHPEHYLQALQMRRRSRASSLESTFDALGEPACQFHLELQKRPVKTSRHLRRLLELADLYGQHDVVAAISRACELQTFDAAYVESILLQQRRLAELPSPTTVAPKRKELIEESDFQEPDPTVYDQLFGLDNESPSSTDSHERPTQGAEESSGARPPSNLADKGPEHEQTQERQ